MRLDAWEPGVALILAGRISSVVADWIRLPGRGWGWRARRHACSVGQTQLTLTLGKPITPGISTRALLKLRRMTLAPNSQKCGALVPGLDVTKEILAPTRR
ncbi:hypothetical protein ARGLB_040_00380 [Arthrobacter globiformis NBRC 12137]|uniref:Uncharacterized protein n=1 Tax=Arthrobacter globiformis (strain ATCC 8010 / DSM 20124 / JCM 1332 / NBRC 12137 / NCIMB 8907 / NRRL B-2979 / 168) TaxID=1077972 RepID=H0QL83_ARTG1|nr:hypothetical protein ARGLB_040_00380 [Arthrobacter globiformis NBRC 12137]